MSHLKLVGQDPPKPARRKGERHEASVLTPAEQKRARAALRNLRDSFGTLACLADAMQVPYATLKRVYSGRAPVSSAVLLRAMRASGLTLDDMLGSPALAGRCRACGQIKRVA